MEDWQRELDRLLFPQGALFSKDAIAADIVQEIRKLMKHERLPFFTAILLRDGFGSLAYRTLSFIISIGCPLIIMLARLSRGTTWLFIVVCALISVPGWWMWSYYFLPLEMKIESMMNLFHNKQKRTHKKLLKKEG